MSRSTDFTALPPRPGNKKGRGAGGGRGLGEGGGGRSRSLRRQGMGLSSRRTQSRSHAAPLLHALRLSLVSLCGRKEEGMARHRKLVAVHQPSGSRWHPTPFPTPHPPASSHVSYFTPSLPVSCANHAHLTLPCILPCCTLRCCWRLCDWGRSQAAAPAC